MGSQVPHTLPGESSDCWLRYRDRQGRAVLHGLPGVHDKDTVRLSWLRRILLHLHHGQAPPLRHDWQQAYKLMIECVKEVQKRLVLNLPNFGVVVVDKDGIHNMETINPEVIAKAA